MKAKTIYGCAVALAVMLSFSSFVAFAGTMDEGDSYTEEYDSVWATAPPTIDGVIDTNEWGTTYIDVEYTVEDDANYTDGSVFIYIMNDANFVYIGVDMTYTTPMQDDEGVWMILAIDENVDEEFADDYSEAMIGVWANQTNSMSMSYTSYLWAISYDESVNSDDDHFAFEFAIPMGELDGVDGEFAFAMYVELDIGNETFMYPIDINIDDELEDADDWAVVTLATAPVAPASKSDKSIMYAMVMFGIGAVIVLILLVAHKETLYKWIAQGDDKYVFIALGVSVVFFLLGFLQWYYDWLGWIL